jgi:NADH dehydrogenase
VVVGAGLFAAFPVVYGVFLGAFYFPVLAMLLGLIFRGTAFEFRFRSEGMRPLWDRGFFLGSTVVAFVQGAAVGAMMRGIPVVNGQYAGGSFGWLHPFAILTGIGLVLGYALLGATWLVLKSEGELRDWARRRVRWLAAGVFAVLFLAFTVTFDYSALAQSNLHEHPWLLALPAIAALALAGNVLGAGRQHDGLSFALAGLFFLASFLTLGTMFWPYMIPYSITVANAAAPDASLRFLFYGGVLVLPFVAAYTIGVYWAFRGKSRGAYVDELPAGVASGQRAAHRIIVIGGGAGGLELVTRLGDTLGRRGLADVMLIDKSRTHLWKPLLHEVAAGSMDFAVQEMEFRAQAHWHHFHYRAGELIGLDRAKREIELAPFLDHEGHEVVGRRCFGYDTLIIAIGSHGNDFGTPGVREHAVLLDSADDAKRFHELLLDSFMRAESQSEQLKPEHVNLAIIGAGATGTELAAELRCATRELATSGYDRIDPEKDVSINLIEAADRILPPLPKRLADEALKLLEDLRVRVHTSARVKEVTANGVNLADGTFIPAELVVWAAGVKGPDILTKLDGLETNRASQLVVLPTLQTTRDPNIFAIGDCAACPWVDQAGKPVPPRAQAAHQQASHLARQLKRSLGTERAVKPWRYRDFGSLVSLGDYSTVGNLMGGLWVEGLLARVMYISLYKTHRMALHGIPTVVLESLANSITRRTEPHVKLH